MIIGKLFIRLDNSSFMAGEVRVDPHKKIVDDYIHVWTERKVLFMFEDHEPEDAAILSRPIMRYEEYLIQKYGDLGKDLIAKSDPDKIRKINIQVEMYNKELARGKKDPATFRIYCMNVEKIIRRGL